MNCQRMEELLIEYVDGVIGRADRSAVEAHLAGCAACRERAAGFRLVGQRLDTWEAPEVSPWFNSRLRSRIAAEEARRWGWRDWLIAVLQPRYVTALAAILMAGTFAIWSGRPAPVTQTTAPVAEQRLEDVVHVVDDYELLKDFEVLGELKPAKRQI